MRISLDMVEGFAGVLEYPGEDLRPRAAALADRMQGHAGVWVDLLEAFALEVQLLPPGDLEEAYTRTFDLNPSCTLEIGWHLFGETYKRGSFLANLREALRTHGVEEGNALPDFLPSLLRLLPRLAPEDTEGLVRDCIRPALAKIRGALGEGCGPYAHLMESLEILLTELAPGDSALAAQAPGASHDCNCSHTGPDGKEIPHAH